MERPSVCPSCLSRFADIHGMTYPDGKFTVGTACTDTWHKGPGYDPAKLNLTPEDIVFLAGQNIGF